MDNRGIRLIDNVAGANLGASLGLDFVMKGTLKDAGILADCGRIFTVLFFLVFMCYNVMIEFCTIGEAYDFGSNQRGG